MEKITLKITSCRGRLVHQYPGQSEPQDRYIEVSSDGRLHIDWNGEIGNAVPARVFNGIERRIHIPWTTKREALEFISAHRKNFERLVAGMSTEWDGNNNVGRLTPDAREALDAIEYAGYSEA